ncbi:hypothetical protein [Algiphilus sp.]|uniref:hypothetical protein n=1 Tax=Algiphilus sp. TaxID=1872431 RepID=UPI003C49444A
MRKPGAAVLTALLALAALPAVGAPEYRCHPERVGHGTVSDHLAARLRETANLEGEVARAEHEALRDFTSATSLAGGIVRARLAGHYLRAGRADEALEQAVPAITRTRFHFRVHRDGEPLPEAQEGAEKMPSAENPRPAWTPPEPPGLSTACVRSPDTAAP